MAMGNAHRHFLGNLLKNKKIEMINTLVEKIDRSNIDLDVIRAAGKVLREGGLVAFPTETVYGLGGDGLNPESSRKIYEAKGRPSDNPLIIHVADFESIKKIAASIPDTAKKLADAFWPGPMTMILPKSEIVPMETTGGLNTIAIRMPKDDIALELIRCGGGYVAAPSANASGRPSPTKASHVYEDLNERIDMILDGGEVGIGVESTIIDLSEETPVILRPGYITKEMFESVIGHVIYDPGLTSVDASVKPKAPGMKYRHYAPKADLSVVEGDKSRVMLKMKDLIADNLTKGIKTGIICNDEDKISFDNADYVIGIGAQGDEEMAARHLYDALREFDSTDVDVIYSIGFGESGLAVAIMNRLLKAAGQKVITV